MKELLDLKKAWEMFVAKWRTSFGWIVLLVIMFFIGMTVKEKLITDDCKYMGSFRDGPQAYSCQVRIK